VWVVAHEGAEVPGYVTIPHTASGNYLVGGPSNVGGLFRDWATRFLAPPAERALDPGAIPVWAPYPRGERVPLNDHTRRASLHHLDLTHDAAAIVRATDEASAFVVKRAVDAAVTHAGVQPKRVVASGGGTRVDAWVQAIADVTGLPVDCVAVPEGGALGSAWLARIAAGLEEPMAMTEGRRWAKVGRRVEPRDAWTAASAARYEEFLTVS
jgi:xylulokinase